MSTTHISRGSGQYLTFKLGSQEYAVALLQVREILRHETITRVPSTPSYLRGVINLRGAVVPVVDLAARIGRAPLEVTKWTCIIIVETEMEGSPTVMGLMVDAVNQVVELPAGQVVPPPPFGTNIRVDYLVGVGKHDNALILIMDVDKVLSGVELLEEVQPAALEAAAAGSVVNPESTVADHPGQGEEAQTAAPVGEPPSESSDSDG